MSDLHSIASLKRAALEFSRIETEVHGQIDAVTKKETREGKPFYEITLADAEAKLTLRAWSDAPAFAACEHLTPGAFIAVAGEFAHSSNYGVDAKRWTPRPLQENEREVLLGGRLY